MEALRKLAQLPATSALSTMEAMSDCRDGAMALRPPS